LEADFIAKVKASAADWGHHLLPLYKTNAKKGEKKK
jgi:hypothetical protein